MAKWNPKSNVNTQHLLNIIRRGDNAYLEAVAELVTGVKSLPKLEAKAAVTKAVDEGYLPKDAVTTLWPTSETVDEAKVAAAQDAKAAMIDNLLALGQKEAVDAMVAAGTLPEELVAEVEANRAAEEA